MFDSEVWGVGNCGEIDKYFGGFLKKLLRVKQSTNTSMIYAETKSFALSVSVKLSIVKYWLKVINSGDNQLNPGTPYGTYMSHVFFLHLLHEYNKKNYFKLSPNLL